MQQFIRVFLFNLILSSIIACGSAVIPQRPEELRLEPSKVGMAKPERWVLDNGLIVLFLHDDELPVVQGSIMLKGGSLFEPADRIGLAHFTGSQMREGGPKGMGADEFDTLLDSLGASVESSFGDEYGVVSFSSLEDDFETVFSLFSRIVREPAFDEERLLLAKKLAQDAILRRRDDPEIMANMAFKMLLYGEGSPYSRAASPQSVDAIMHKDLVEFHKTYAQPQGAILAISGDVRKERLKALIEMHFGSWRGDKADKTLKFPAVEGGTKQPGVYVLQRDFDQSTIVMGHLGPQRLHPDMYDLAVYDKYFGDGAWGSLLFSEIRSKLGLAYSIYGDFSGGPVAGTYAIVLQTRNAEALNAVERVKDLVIKSATEMPAPSAYEEAKHQINRSFVFKFPNARSVVERNAILELLQYPKDFDSSYLDKIAAVTSASSLAAAKRHVKPSDLVIVIVGNVSPQEVRRRFGGKLRVYSLNFDHAPHVDNHFPVE